MHGRTERQLVMQILALLAAAPEQPAPVPLTEPTEYTGVRCMCVLTGCQAGPGCPHYTEHCRKHIDHERALLSAFFFVASSSAFRRSFSPA